MKRIIFMAILFMSSMAFTNCREKETKVIVQEQVTETPEDQGVLERLGEKVDEEVNKEIDEEIEKIGDDNK